jgi:hypothetical protein
MTKFLNSKLTTQNPKLSIIFILILFFIGDLTIFHALKSGMDRYYGLNKPAKILCVGHSHTVLGIDAERLEKELGVPVAKYAMAGANTLDRLWMLRQFVGRHPSVKTVLYDVEPRLFDTKGLSSASYTLFLPYIDDPYIARYLRQEATWQEYLSAKVIRTTRFRDQTINIAMRGLLNRVENKKTTLMRIEDLQGALEKEKSRSIRINKDALACFQETIDFLTGNDINVFLVFIPIADLLNAIDPERQEAVIQIFKTAAETDHNVFFLNYNQDYQHRHELFYDLRHLNSDGNDLVTGRLVEDLSRFE